MPLPGLPYPDHSPFNKPGTESKFAQNMHEVGEGVPFANGPDRLSPGGEPKAEHYGQTYGKSNKAVEGDQGNPRRGMPEFDSGPEFRYPGANRVPPRSGPPGP